MLHIYLFFLQSKEVFIEFDSSHQSYQLGKLNDPLTSLSCLMVLELTENIDPLSLLNQLPSSLWEKSTANIGKIHSELSVEIQINFLKHLLLCATVAGSEDREWTMSSFKNVHPVEGSQRNE